MMPRLQIAILIVFLFFAPQVSTKAQETKIIIAEGIGKDIEGAVQNGAEAALTQILGSFVDAETIINKRVVLKKGIKTRSKSISSKFREYSQGSIKKLDVIDVTQENGLTRVVVKVAILVEDFKYYIEKIVLAEKKVKKGLLAQLKIKKKQEKNLAGLIKDRVLKPVLNYKVIDIKLSEISEVVDPKILSQVTLTDDEYLITVDAKVKLNQSFLDNALRMLDETAEKKYSCLNYAKNPFNKPQHSMLLGIGLDHNNSGQQTYCGLKAWERFGKKVKLIYGFPARSSQLCNKLGSIVSGDRAATQSPWWRRMARQSNAVKPALSLKFLSDKGKTIKEEVLTVNHLDLLISGNAAISTDNGKYTGASLIGYGGFEGAVNKPETNCSFFVRTEASFSLIIKVNSEILSSSEKITLNYTD